MKEASSYVPDELTEIGQREGLHPYLGTRSPGLSSTSVAVRGCAEANCTTVGRN